MLLNLPQSKHCYELSDSAFSRAQSQSEHQYALSDSASGLVSHFWHVDGQFENYSRRQILTTIN